MRKFIRHDGKKVEVYRFGNGTKTLVLLPGWTHCFQYEYPFITELTRIYTVLTFSYPGYRGSDENRKAASMEYVSSIIDTLAAAEKTKPDALIGFSMGCQVALHYMSRHPKTKGVFLSPLLVSPASQAPWYGKILLALPGFMQIVRMSINLKQYFVSQTYSHIGRITEGDISIPHFQPGYITLNGAFDTLVANVTSFTDPVRFRSRITFVFGEGEIMQQRLAALNIPFKTLPGSGHDYFTHQYTLLAGIIRTAIG